MALSAPNIILVHEISPIGQNSLDRCGAIRLLNKIPCNDMMLVVQLPVRNKCIYIAGPVNAH